MYFINTLIRSTLNIGITHNNQYRYTLIFDEELHPQTFLEGQIIELSDFQELFFFNTVKYSNMNLCMKPLTFTNVYEVHHKY